MSKPNKPTLNPNTENIMNDITNTFNINLTTTLTLT